MAGRISEYLTLSKVLGTELVDVSAVDAGSPTGYTTFKTTVQDLADFNPSIYSTNSDLTGNRTVNQDGNYLVFNNGDFGLDEDNQGFFYEDLTKRIGIGTNTPSSSLHIKGQSGDDLLTIEDSTSALLHEFQDDGKVFLCKNGQFFQAGLTTNYLKHNVQTTTQFSSTATYTGFHVNRNGQGIAIRTQSTGRSHIDFTGELLLNNNWNNNAASGQGTEVMRIKSTGVINISNVPTSNTGLIAGDIWNDAGTLKIV